MTSTVDHVKKFIPKGIKTYVKESLRQRQFRRAFASYAAIPANETPSAAILQELISAWGNEGYSAMTEYLLALRVHASQATGPILECGSGLSTLLLGLEASRRGMKVWTLEHHPEWAGRMQRDIAELGLTSIELCQAPLKSYGEFTWYDAPLRAMPKQFALAVCDGPPGDTPGGRYGLIVMLRDRFSPGGLVLIDDYQRAEEQAIAQRWVRETGSTLQAHGTDKPYAVLHLP